MGIGAYEKTERLFTERETRVNWLHAAGCYEALLLIVGVPLALWAGTRIGAVIVGAQSLPNVVVIGIYVYLFFFVLNIFRSLFSYARWAFPKVELSSEHSMITKHRVILGGIIVGILGSALWDAVKAIF